MAVKVREIPQMKVKYKDVFHLKNLYIMMHEYLLEEQFLDYDQRGGQQGHSAIEHLYLEKICQKGLHAGGKEIWIWWRTLKNPETKYQGYYRYHLDIDFHVVYAQKRTLKHQGKDVNVIWGECEIFFRGWIEGDYKNQWDNHPILKHFHKLYYERILSHEFDKREKELWRDIVKLTSKVKKFLNLRTFVPVSESFWHPIYGYEA